MLGLSRRNHRIHPRFKAAALELQQTTGRQLHELPPDLLFRELGYASVALLCLSPTDSIIEAIRCALELDVPLYGIDRDDPATPAERAGLNLRDPLAARGDLAAYVRQVGPQANGARDDSSDGRRETVMAARLKTLLRQHQRVLFTGGIAHWPHLCRLLADDSLQPAHRVPQDGPTAYQRVLVHPRQALPQMDLFPRVSAAYEAARQPVDRSSAGRVDLDFQAEFRHCLDAALARYAAAAGNPAGQSRSAQHTHGLAGYTRYLLDVCMLSQCLAPNVSTALTAARAMTPGAFVEVLTETLMEFDWASPERFSDLPLIGPAPTTTPSAESAALRAVMRAPRAAAAEDPPIDTDSAPFYLAPLHGDQGPGITEFSWSWHDESPLTVTQEGEYHFQFVWPPCEYLFYASIYEAIQVADVASLESRTEPCTGPLHDGIDLKATLRSGIHGEPRLVVKRTRKRPPHSALGQPGAPSYTPHLELQPTVFIFSDPGDVDDLSWETLIAGTVDLYDDLSARGKKLFHAVVTKEANYLLESIHCAAPVPVPAALQPWVRTLRLLHGSVRFGNPCVNFHQAAAWLEKGRFKAAPILPAGSGVEDAAALYLRRHDLRIDLEDWRNALISFALPYAGTARRVVVVCPKDFRLGEDVRRAARRRRVELFTLPLTHFPAARIEQIRRQYSVMAERGGKAFPPELERVLGQKETTYLDLLPPQIRRQTRPRADRGGSVAAGR